MKVDQSLRRRYLYLIIVAIVVSGCASVRPLREEALIRLYAQQSRLPKKNPVIFIHGMLGSILKDPESRRPVWGEKHEGSMEDLALPIDGKTLADNKDTLVPVDVVGGYSWLGGLIKKDVYQRTKEVAIRAGGYIPNQDAFVFVYDWRRDVVETAKQLNTFIEEIKKKRGEQDLAFTLVAHSMGGLVARYYVKYGGVDVLGQEPMPAPTYAGAKNVNRVIMLGTPNCGSLLVFKRLNLGLHLPTICDVSAKTVFTLPALYELLPPPGEQVFVDRDGKALEVDLYDPNNWEKYGWSVFNPKIVRSQKRELLRKYGEAKGEALYKEQREKYRRFLALVLERTKKLYGALWNGDLEEERKRVSYVLLGGDSKPTLQRVILEKENSGWRLQFNSEDKGTMELLYGFGDSDVTKNSFLGLCKSFTRDSSSKMLRLPSAYEVFMAEKHDSLADNPTYLDNMLHILLDTSGGVQTPSL